jgi:hypothetical protein
MTSAVTGFSESGFLVVAVLNSMGKRRRRPIDR